MHDRPADAPAGGARPGARADELLDRFDLAEAADRRVATYSGGMRRRLDLAMSLIGRPRVIFLDEPTTGLDPRQPAGRCGTPSRDLVADGTTVLLTTQYLEEADRLADQIVLIDDGRVVARGTADELKAQVGGEPARAALRRPETRRRSAASCSRRVPPTPTRCTVDVPSDGSADDLRRLLDPAGRRARCATVTEHSPTLDDVFLTLTGHRASAEQGTRQEVSA